jgi:hypothetical protein
MFNFIEWIKFLIEITRYRYTALKKFLRNTNMTEVIEAVIVILIFMMIIAGGTGISISFFICLLSFIG